MTVVQRLSTPYRSEIACSTCWARRNSGQLLGRNQEQQKSFHRTLGEVTAAVAASPPPKDRHRDVCSGSGESLSTSKLGSSWFRRVRSSRASKRTFGGQETTTSTSGRSSTRNNLSNYSGTGNPTRASAKFHGVG